MNHALKGSVGVLVAESEGPLPFAEASFCRKLCQIGERKGMCVYVFCLPSISEGNANGIPGYMFERGGWVRKRLPRPDIVYDRCLTYDRKGQLRKQRLLSRLAAKHPYIYLTRGLAGKWAVHQALSKYRDLAPYLPETALYEGPLQLAEWLEAHDKEVFLKPRNGTHGRRTLYVKLADSGEQIGMIGRSGSNTLFKRRFSSRKAGLEWIDKFIGARPYLIQPYLQLNNAQGEPFDTRVLMQKNEKGEWSLTGMAVRVGPKHSLTSNLHGGGTAHKALPYLIRELGETAGISAVQTIRHLSLRIPEYLETCFGRLAELGLDFGVDREGKVWILEVNSKPGRTSLFRIGDPISARKSIENPISYARYLLLSKP
ncbi:YheC/YheD family protein [Paenibacillus macerans]|uniref:YheC/YheD family endospore coat-associated protein n=1 Tax=Paenibacillus macerans TaxID=44252 RepID=UPI00203CED69|nr:YheC/YheD family protein [Paenibacillus macerans]MCM3702987.1 YheC/YheD family protein [Paenibacillus macerans]